MKFLCFAYEDEKSLNDLSASEWDALRRDTLAYVETLRANGQLIATHALRARVSRRRSAFGPTSRSSPTAPSPRRRSMSVVDAPNLDEAVALALGWPSARIGAIEVRPIEEELPTDKRYA
jgi:hypothetical protein